MTISIIIINFNSKKYLEKCLLSIHEKILLSARNRFFFEIIVINNEKEPLLLDSDFLPKPKIIHNPKNTGFGSGSNLGAKQAKGDYLFFLNPDVKLLDDSLLDMIEYIDSRSEIGIIGPKLLLSQTGLPQPWTSGKKTSLWSIVFRNTIGKPWNKKKPVLVDWVSGTALLIRKKLYEKINGFDEKFFMYFEDQDLCLRAKEQGAKVLFYPHARIIHFSGKSWSGSKSQKKYYYQSQEYFFSKHHGTIQKKILNFLSLLRKHLVSKP